MMKSLIRPAALVLTLGLAACGDDAVPTAPAPPLPAMAGTWGVQWFVQFERTHDGFSGSYYCWGTMTLSQSATSGQSATLDGFTVIQSGCPQGTYDVSSGSMPFTRPSNSPSMPCAVLNPTGLANGAFCVRSGPRVSSW